MRYVAPWATGPLELLVHAEGHLRSWDDFDRRMALIGFDNAVEVSISTFLSLKPIQRGNRKYAPTDVEKWLANYHSKLDFVQGELDHRGLGWEIRRPDIVWAHDHRNEQYHGGFKGTPERRVVLLIRAAALWVFGLLFEIDDVNALVDEELALISDPVRPQSEPSYDRLIDDAFGLIDVCGQRYYASELLFSTDHDAYRVIGAELTAPDGGPNKVDAPAGPDG